MSRDRMRARRAFRPELDGHLEDRALLSPFLRPSPHPSTNPVAGRTADGGRAIRLKDTDGEIFTISVENAGVVRARPLPGGRVGLIVDGSTVDSNLVIDYRGRAAPPGGAHQFSAAQARQDRLLNVGYIQVSSGRLGAILGYRTAVLSGPLIVGGTDPVQRVAFYDLRPGAEIGVGGDLQTLDVYHEASLVGGVGISVGRDLDLINVGTNLSLAGGASILVGRDLGPITQPSKGTGPGGAGGNVQGNLTLAPGSFIVVNRGVFAPIFVRGNITGINQVIPKDAVNTFTASQVT